MGIEVFGREYHPEIVDEVTFQIGLSLFAE